MLGFTGDRGAWENVALKDEKDSKNDCYIGEIRWRCKKMYYTVEEV